MKKVKHRGHGFKTFDHHRLRVLHAGGVTWPPAPDRHASEPALPTRTRRARLGRPGKWNVTGVEERSGRPPWSLRLPAELRSASVARAFVERELSGHVDDLPAVVLMTSELVTNGALHANTAVTVTVREGPPVRVEVHDDAAATDAFREIVTAGRPIPNASAVRGRGLDLVRALSTRLGLDDDPDGGKVVWFEVDREAPASIR